MLVRKGDTCLGTTVGDGRTVRSTGGLNDARDVQTTKWKQCDQHMFSTLVSMWLSNLLEWIQAKTWKGSRNRMQKNGFVFTQYSCWWLLLLGDDVAVVSLTTMQWNRHRQESPRRTNGNKILKIAGTDSFSECVFFTWSPEKRSVVMPFSWRNRSSTNRSCYTRNLVKGSHYTMMILIFKSRDLVLLLTFACRWWRSQSDSDYPTSISAWLLEI